MTTSLLASALDFIDDFRTRYNQAVEGAFPDINDLLLGIPFAGRSMSDDVVIWRLELRKFTAHLPEHEIDALDALTADLHEKGSLSDAHEQGIMRFFHKLPSGKLFKKIEHHHAIAALKLRWAIYYSVRSRPHPLLVSDLLRSVEASYLRNRQEIAPAFYNRTLSRLLHRYPIWRDTGLVSDPASADDVIQDAINRWAARSKSVKVAAGIRSSRWRQDEFHRQIAEVEAAKSDDRDGIEITEAQAAALASEGVEVEHTDTWWHRQIDSVLTDISPIFMRPPTQKWWNAARNVVALRENDMPSSAIDELVRLQHAFMTGVFNKATEDAKLAEAQAKNDEETLKLAEILENVRSYADAVDAETHVIKEPTLVVLRGIEHLPYGAKGDNKPRDLHTPSAEFRAMAGKRLTLVTVDHLAPVVQGLTHAFPWCKDGINTIAMDVVGRPHFRLRPTLFVGQPGCGKTALARALALEFLGVEATVYGCASGLDASFAGTSRQWGTGRACIPLQAIRRDLIANPLIVLDELEKSGGSSRNGKLADALLAFLERETSRVYHDPYVECAVDLSAVTYVATANSLDGVSDALRSRFRIIRIDMPSITDIAHIASRQLVNVRDDLGSDSTWTPDLTLEEIGLIEQVWRQTPERSRSLRLVRRAVETIVAGRDALAARH
jgi:hypothetical protein